MKVIDYSAGVPSATSVKAAGYGGAVRYISPGREAWMKGKPIGKAEVDDFLTNGLSLAYVWQYGKENDSDVLRGRAGGLADARAAQSKLNELGQPNHPVFFAVDFDISLKQWDDTAVHYFRACCEILGRERVGIYGHSRVIAWAQEDNVVATVAPGRVLGWQTKSWSNGVKASDYAVLYQGVHDIPGPGGIDIDVNEVLFSNWGQHSVGVKTPIEGGNVVDIKPFPGRKGDPLWLPDVLRAFGVTVKEAAGWKNWGNGDFGTIWGVVAHHTGANNTSPEFIARNPMLSNKLSSQIHLDRKGVVTLVGAGIAWHAGTGSYPGIARNNANAVTIGIEAQSDGVSPWPDAELDAYYRICAAICWYLGLDSSRVISHHEWSDQGKWDPGLGGKPMDMRVFRKNVQNYIDNPPFETSGKSKNEGEGLFMSLSHERQEDLAQKIDRLYHESTHEFPSRYPESTYRDTLIGYVLELDRKVEDIHANQLPTIFRKVSDILGSVKDLFTREVK